MAWSHGLIRVVTQQEARTYTAEAHGGDLMLAGLADELSAQRHEVLPPDLVRVNLCPSWSRHGQRVGVRPGGGSEDVAVGGRQDGLAAAGADVHAKQDVCHCATFPRASPG